MCATTNNKPSHYLDHVAEQAIMKWRLKERLLESEGEFSMAIEIKTWDGAPLYYGSIEIYWVETHIDARAFYQYGNRSIDNRHFQSPILLLFRV
jgi:hypothetical protein